MKIAFLLFALLSVRVESSRKCSTATGFIRCSKDPSKHNNVIVEMLDRDGIGPIFQWLDPDDSMSIAITNKEGIFELNGCGSDIDVPFGLYENKPDPYITFKHYCNTKYGERVRLPEFATFHPHPHDAGAIDLDNNIWHQDSSKMLEKINEENGS